MSPLPGGGLHCVIPYIMWVPVTVRLVANSYTCSLFTLLSLLLHLFNGLLFQDNLDKPAPEKQIHSGKTNLDLLEQEIVSGSGISWATCKSAPRPRQITMPASHHSTFYRPDALLPPNQQHQSTEGKLHFPYFIESLGQMSRVKSRQMSMLCIKQHCQKHLLKLSTSDVSLITRWCLTLMIYQLTPEPGWTYVFILLHPYNGLFSKTTWVSRHQKGKPFLIMKQKMMTVASAGPYADHLHFVPER